MHLGEGVDYAVSAILIFFLIFMLVHLIVGVITSIALYRPRIFVQHRFPIRKEPEFTP